MQEVKTDKPKVELPPLPAGFTFIKELGRGNFAGVVLARYTITDQMAEVVAANSPDKASAIALHQRIKSLCDERGCVAVKLTLKPDPHEAEIAQYLYDQAQQKPRKTGMYNLSVPCADALICQYISYDDAPDPPRSSNVESFIRNMTSNKGTGESPDKVANAFHANVGVSLSQLGNSAYGSIAHMHSEGVIHLDLATRNLFINKPTYDVSGNIVSFIATVGDYGLSEKLSEEGNFTPPEGVRIRSPMRWASSNITDDNTADVSSDLFAVKALMIGMTGLALGAVNEHDVLALTQPNDMKNFITARFGDGPYASNDKKVLKKYLSNVTHLLAQCPDEKKKAELSLYIECYRKYLTRMPPNSATNEEAQKADHDLIIKCNEQFIRKMFHAQLEAVDLQNPASEKEISLLAKRLLTLEVSDTFKETEHFQRLLTHSAPPKVNVSQGELLARIVEMEAKVKSQLGSHKWAFITGQAMGNHPRALLALALKGEIEQLKQDVRDEKITTLESVNVASKGMQDRLAHVNQPAPQKSSVQQPTSTLGSSKQTADKINEVELPRINMRR